MILRSLSRLVYPPSCILAEKLDFVYRFLVAPIHNCRSFRPCNLDFLNALFFREFLIAFSGHCTYNDREMGIREIRTLYLRFHTFGVNYTTFAFSCSNKKILHLTEKNICTDAICCVCDKYEVCFRYTSVLVRP